MSSDYYFKKWKNTLIDLEALVNFDNHLQETKAHDKKLCEATERLSGILARYKVIYNNVWDCLHQTLQVQKTSYIHNVLKAVVSRILELKLELQKLEVSEHNFGCKGLIDHKLTPDDLQLSEIPDVYERPENIRNVIEEVFEQVKERKKQLEEEAARKVTPDGDVIDWWDADNIEEDENIFTDKKKDELSEEQKKIKNMVLLIQAHEKTRRVIAERTQQCNKRFKWEKELTGTLQPSAPYNIRKQAATLIQQVCRSFFKLKRQKVLQCRKDELLGLNLCYKPQSEQKHKLDQAKESRRQLKRQYEEKWKTEYESLKQVCLKRKSEDIKEYYRDYLRDWFKTWYESILFFHDIPEEKQGGIALIFKEELPTPEEWLEDYNTYQVQKKANQGTSGLDKKMAKLEAKREEMERKKAEHLREKMEAQLRKKMMKNPTLHPGYNYPVSKKTNHILEVICHYYNDWAELDARETLDVKEKNVLDIDMSNVYMEVKLDLVSAVEDDMRNELKLLKRALKIDYDNQGEKMPEQMKQKYKRQKKKKKVQKNLSVNITEKLEDLAFHGYMKEYPKTKINEFIGDPNFAGDDLRCNYVAALPHNGEMRNLWWDRCRELMHGFKKILLIGPKGGGKTTLTQVLATMNDAVLFELDPRKIHGMLETEASIEHLVKSVATCARAVQPSVIYIKHVHMLFCRKIPPEDAAINWKLIQRYFIKILFRQIQKTDKVTVIGSCVDPWLTTSKQMLKQFQSVVLLPNTSHGTVAQILKDWILSYTVIPADLDVSCLAQVLKGYSYGYLKSILKKFMSAETIIRIAAHGLSPMDVYNFIIEDGTEEKVDYEKYLSWYREKTTWGSKEHKHQQEQLEFKQALADYAEKMKKNKSSKN